MDFTALSSPGKVVARVVMIQTEDRQTENVCIFRNLSFILEQACVLFGFHCLKKKIKKLILQSWMVFLFCFFVIHGVYI